MINIQENVQLAPYTSFRVGGNADFYVEIKNLEELKEALQFAKEKNIDFYILGGGTNLLVSDKGFNGLVIRMKMNEICVDENLLEVHAGVPLIKAVNVAASAGLSGFEKLAGIPGTMGGAIRGNAGAFGSETKECVESVTAFDCESNEIVILDKERCQFAYRSSIFKQNKKLIVLSAKFNLRPGDPEEIQNSTKETILKRAANGLHGVRSAGSYFMNPIVENEKLKQEFTKEKGVEPREGKLPAGWVIEQAGLRGKQIGGAAVSDKHANYIINANDATADQVMMLVSFVKQQVRDQFGVQLHEEIEYVGF